MSELLPGTLARSRRGLCPTCGAALSLGGSGRLVTCGFCGASSGLERRLRKVDADVELPALRAAEGAGSDARWLAEALGESRAEAVPCPGCGDAFEGDFAHDILTCSSCGTQCKVERRMVRPRAEARALPERRTHTDFLRQRRDDARYRWDVQTEQLAWRVLNEPDFDRQVAYALKFEDWGTTNASTVYFLPHLLALAGRSELRLAGPLCACAGMLLCQEDARLYAPTLEACEPFALDPRGPDELLHQIGLGKARGLKLLLDAADAAARAGAMDHAAHALWAAQTMIGRNYDEHPTIAEILLYRLFYLSPVVTGWVLHVVQSGEGGYVFKDPYPLLEFIDDCAYERPELVGCLARCPYAPEVATVAEMRERLRFVEARLSKTAKSAALTTLTNVAPDAPEEVLGELVRFVEPWLDDRELRDASIAQLRRSVRLGEGLAAPVVDLIRRRGHSLPEIVQREVHWKVPDNTLLDPTMIPPFYDGEPEVPLHPVVTEALAAYDAAIRRAVNTRNETYEEASAFWEKMRALEVPLFEEEPP